MKEVTMRITRTGAGYFRLSVDGRVMGLYETITDAVKAFEKWMEDIYESNL